MTTTAVLCSRTPGTYEKGHRRTLVAQCRLPYGPGVLSPTVAAGLAMTASFAVFGLATVWYALPWLRARPFEQAVVPLLWINAGRYVALQLISAQQFGFVASDSALRQIVYGDLIGAALAIASLVALRARWSGARLLVWVLVGATVVDLGNALRIGLAEDLFSTAHDVSLIILTFYVPALWISAGLITWLLLRSPVRAESPPPRHVPS